GDVPGPVRQFPPRRGPGVRPPIAQRRGPASHRLLRRRVGTALAKSVPDDASGRHAADLRGDGTRRRTGNAAVASDVHRRRPGRFAGGRGRGEKSGEWAGNGQNRATRGGRTGRMTFAASGGCEPPGKSKYRGVHTPRSPG